MKPIRMKLVTETSHFYNGEPQTIVIERDGSVKCMVEDSFIRYGEGSSQFYIDTLDAEEILDMVDRLIMNNPETDELRYLDAYMWKLEMKYDDGSIRSKTGFAMIDDVGGLRISTAIRRRLHLPDFVVFGYDGGDNRPLDQILSERCINTRANTVLSPVRPSYEHEFRHSYPGILRRVRTPSADGTYRPGPGRKDLEVMRIRFRRVRVETRYRRGGSDPPVQTRLRHAGTGPSRARCSDGGILEAHIAMRFGHPEGVLGQAVLKGRMHGGQHHSLEAFPLYGRHRIR